MNENILAFPTSLRLTPRTSSSTAAAGPLEEKLRKTLSGTEKSGYADSFDWSIYDKIQNRYSEPLRGGAMFSTTLKLANYHATCSQCHYALELDTYGRGCIHNCTYCYAKDQLSRHGYWNRPHPMPVNLAEIRKIFYTVFETSKTTKWRPILEKRTPIRLGSMSDSFMWMDKKYGVTKELLRILNFYNYPFIVFTRSDLIAESEYLELLNPELCSVQFSISGDNEKITSQLEPGAPNVGRRLNALSKLNKNGIWTTVRINPFFPTFPDGYFSSRAETEKRFHGEKIPQFPLFTSELLDKIKLAGTKSILAGFVRLSNSAIKNISTVTEVDLRPFFKPEILRLNGDKHYSDSEISYYYGELKLECLKRDLNFSTCYIGNGIKDYFQYQDLWSNKKDCCDAVGNVSGFKNTSQNITWENRIQFASNKKEAALSKEITENFTAASDKPTKDFQ